MASALALFILILTLLAGTVPSLFGYESFVVLSGSMEPALSVGDLAVVAPVPSRDMMVGDIITYRTAQRPDIVVTHRLVGIALDERGRTMFQTRGDANNAVDQVQVDQNAVLGRVAFHIPRLGYLVDFSKRPEGRILLIGIPGLLLALDYLLGARRKKKTEIRQVHSEAGELVTRGRVALENGGSHAALTLADRAIAADPHYEDAWLFKAECLSNPQDRVACLRAGLTVNPTSARLKEAVERATALEAAAS